MKKIRAEKGAVLIEAMFVFPIMFFVIGFLIFFGNVMYQRSRVDSCVDKYAVEGAAQCGNYYIKTVEENGSVPTNSANIDPYRYIFGKNQGNVEGEIEKKVKQSIGGDGFFAGMSLQDVNCTAKYDNYVIYSSFTVEATYTISLPWKFIWEDEIVMFRLSAKKQAPVSDPAELIRNTNMVIDYINQSGLDEKINNLTEKIKKFFG